ncbi:oxidoreductase [Flavobacterium silvaticum]|uniref:SDR family NAD(P)-dependent oxidoreductase n=1 Tax=Flavobacterium silvaticum TaxID=1852020 RepID=A0A972JHQ3_9FLAO|nr:oxidoreductase [Flavobacterium silvaticum]NMH28185.1 SDR family NAD(P)-dependent oxidoreductase [Flavobacterium silvaticum]
MNNVWFITGASKGFGLEMTQQLLAKGDKVAATTRNKTELEKLIGTNENFLPLAMNIVDEADVKRAVDETVSKFGKLDFVVNNAGYGLFGSVEELSDEESRKNFDVNVFGSLNVIRQSLPILRKQRSGHIFNISSIGGYLGDFSGFGIYCATKFAVIGFTEALAVEAKDFGIKVTAVLPGYFRTNFLNSDSLVTPKTEISDYAGARESQRVHQEQISNNQPGDPVKGVAAIIEAAENENPPVHLFLGSDAYGLAVSKADAMKAELEQWKELTVNTDF